LIGFDFVTDRDKIKEIMRNKDLVFFFGLIYPRMPKVFLFATKLEYLYFPPNTEKNKEFLFGTSELGGTIWAMIGVPKESLELARRVAEECQLDVANEIPYLLSEKKAFSFLTDKKNLFSLANAESSNLWNSDPWEIEEVIKEEDREIVSIIENPEKYKERKAREPKKVKLQWE